MLSAAEETKTFLSKKAPWKTDTYDRRHQRQSVAAVTAAASKKQRKKKTVQRPRKIVGLGYVVNKDEWKMHYEQLRC
jgi:hypothetical protein